MDFLRITLRCFFLFYFHDGNKIKKATQCDCALTICQRANHIALLFYLISIMKVRLKKQRNDEVGVRQ